MEIQELFAKHRAHFVDQLLAFYKANNAQDTELLVALDDDDLEGVFLFYRCDAVDEKDNAIDMDPEEFLSHERIEIRVNETRLLIDPFVWSACSVSLQGELIDWEPILSWAFFWMDVDEEKKPNKKGILNVMHQMTPPEKDKDGWTTFLLDLGTAPATALEELVQTLVSDGGISTVLLASPEYTGV